jgi:hypothetical protein
VHPGFKTDNQLRREIADTVASWIEQRRDLAAQDLLILDIHSLRSRRV